MSRCFCCENTLFLGCLTPCNGVIDFGVVVPVGKAGEWKLKAKFNRRTKIFTNELVEGQQIRFGLPCLNDNFTYIFQLEDATGERVTITIANEGSFNCFEVKTQIGEADELILANASIS